MYDTFILRLNIRISERSTECQRSPPIPPIPGFPVVDIPSSGLLVPFFIKEFLKKQFVDNHSQTQCLPDAIHVPIASQMAAIMYSIRGKYPLNVAIEMRLIGYSGIYLSPAQAGMSVICQSYCDFILNNKVVCSQTKALESEQPNLCLGCI